MSTGIGAIRLRPRLPDVAEPYLAQLKTALEAHYHNPVALSGALEHILNYPEFHALVEPDMLTVRLFLEILHDLVRIGWRFRLQGSELIAIPPESVNGDAVDHKEIKQRLRAALIAFRDEQLQETSVRRFILEMEKPRYFQGRMVSVLDLTVSPIEMANDLQRCLDAPPGEREARLRRMIQPYLQLVTDERDPYTNLRLSDIWRYFRYTWSLPFSPQPGRQMFYLVRDAARPNHPVIGLGALGNAVMQITCRDEVIGWSLEAIRRSTNPTETLLALENAIEVAISEIYWSDLVSEKDLRAPNSDTLEHLQEIASQSVRVSKSLTRSRSHTWLDDTLSPQFRRKRALELYNLLKAKMLFQQSLTKAKSAHERLEWLLSTEAGRSALRIAIRAVKKRHVGSSMMEITTCGALPPYSHLLGGKLVALLMASPKVIADYRQRYAATPSEIASRMKGSEVIRPANLVLLGTTSLYYVGSSQYNRLRAPVAKGELRYIQVGLTEGFGSVHISRRTYRTVQELLRRHPELQPESSTFAAGVNYKLRSIAEALSFIGMSDLRKHRSPRLVYLVPLAVNWQRYLTGLDEEPVYLYDDVITGEEETSRLIEFWKERWFIPRVVNSNVVQRLKTETQVLRVSDLLRSSAMREGAQSISFHTVEVGGGAANMSPVLSWKELAQLKDGRTGFAEHLTTQELQELHIQTKIDQRFCEIAKERRIYLTGNPGDGKSFLIRRYQEELAKDGVWVYLDASDTDEESLAQEIRRRAIERNEAKGAVIAVNEGILRRLIHHLPENERRAISEQLNRPFLYGDEKDRDYRPLVINLGLRQVLTDSTIESVLDLVLNRVDYREAPPEVLRNAEALRRCTIRKRLIALLKLVAKSGAHVTIHQLIAFFGYVITGGHAALRRADIPPYHQLVFDCANPLHEWLAPLDPAGITHPLVDMHLWDGDPDGHIRWLYSAPSIKPLQGSNAVQAVDWYKFLKRLHYFEAEDGDKILKMLPEDLTTFYDLLSNSQEAKHKAKEEILRAIGRFFGDEQFGEHTGIRIWTGLKYAVDRPQTGYVSISNHFVSSDDTDLLLPRLRAEVAELIEYQPNHVRLVVRPGGGPSKIGLDIDLRLWLALKRVSRGDHYLRRDPILVRKISQFMSRLAAGARQPSTEYATLYVRDLDSLQTYQVRVSVERGKYYL